MILYKKYHGIIQIINIALRRSFRFKDAYE